MEVLDASGRSINVGDTVRIVGSDLAVICDIKGERGDGGTIAIIRNSDFAEEDFPLYARRDGDLVCIDLLSVETS
jgi:hypothetical protein